ncbi:MAG: glycosyltransferase family 9 protein, partial [Elusimicrobia bacterium]|nr:glycosyltransferase family 9 protein [Elusimicrobiota bacterium]
FKQFCDSHHIPEGKMLIGMNPGSMWKTKRWLPEYFAQVADTLQKERNCQIILFGSDQDKTAVRSVCSFMKSPVINLCGKTDLKTLTSLISRCSLFITNDSGPMHLASAAGVPLVAIFGPTTRELGFFPLGDKSVVVELELPCRPCSLHGGDRCPLKHFKCMRDLRPEVVLRQCRLFLQSVSQ